MPYISKSDRTQFVLPIKSIVSNLESVGELNYVISKICNLYLKKIGKRYQTINSIVGVLECAKQEFYRRVASPYEDKKIKENGDI